jgi:hypothetical protein
MHKNAMKCNETLSKWCKNKHGASKIMDTFEMYQGGGLTGQISGQKSTPLLGANLSFLLIYNPTLNLIKVLIH